MNVPNGLITGVRLHRTGGEGIIATSPRRDHPQNRSVLQFLFKIYEDVRTNGVICKIQHSQLPQKCPPVNLSFPHSYDSTCTVSRKQSAEPE